MAAKSAAALIKAGDSNDRAKTAEFQTTAHGLASRVADLRCSALTRMTANLAGELMNDARLYLAAVHRHFDPVVKQAYAAHREATALRAKFLKPGEDADWIAHDIVRRYKLEINAQAARKQQQADEAARMKAEADRGADVQALNDEGRTEEASMLAQTPLVPIARPVESSPIISGAQTVERKRATVKELGRFLAFIGANSALWHLVEVKQGALDRYVNATGGAIDIPGVEITDDVLVRRSGP